MQIFLPRLKLCGSSTFSVKKKLNSDTVSEAGDEDSAHCILFHYRPKMFAFTRNIFLSCTFRRKLSDCVQFFCQIGGVRQVVPFFARIGIMRGYCTDVLRCSACFASLQLSQCFASFRDVVPLCGSMENYDRMESYGELF